MPYLYGMTKEETARNMFQELKQAVYYNFWDETYNELCKTDWTIVENIPNLAAVSPRLREILEMWNRIPCKKRLTICGDNSQNLQIYFDEDCEDPSFELDPSFDISEEEILELLYIMIDYDVHNNNGWKLDGSNFYEPEKYPPRYPLPVYALVQHQEGSSKSVSRKRRREDTDEMEF